MVSQTVSLPNIRKMFIPDPNYIIIDVDLERADAQVVAWEAGDEELKDLFRTGADVHTSNAMAAFQLPKEEITYHKRQQSKVAVHAYDYGASIKTVAANTGMTIYEATLFHDRWFEAHPKIPEWHDKVKEQLERTKTVRNAFGYENVYFDRIDVKRLHEALAWVPQSTVAVVTNIGLVNIHKNLPQVQPLLQVHDSLVLQAPKELAPAIFSDIRKAMTVTVPYDDPLIIPTGFGISELSWGHLIQLSDVPKLLKAADEQTNITELATIFKTDKETIEMVLDNKELYLTAS